MSLTGHLKYDWELTDELKARFPKPVFNLKGDLLAAQKTKNYAVVGNAFDYLFRAVVKHHYKHRKIIEETWLADHVINKLIQRYNKRNNPKGEFLSKYYSEAGEQFATYHSIGEVTSRLIEGAIFLGQLDLYYRCGYVEDYGSFNQADIEDLKAMLSLVDKDVFKVENKCWLNPHFGEASKLVTGADADLIIDETLIDVKTTKELKLLRRDFNQIFCYYILSLIGGVNGKKTIKPIKKIGIYFARYGLLWTIPLSDIAPAKAHHNFKTWFQQNCLNEAVG